VRVSHRSMVKPVAFRTMGMMKLPTVFRLNLYTEAFVKSFLIWIASLNNARFTFGEEEDLGSISLSAKKTIDLRKTEKFKELFDEGYLRGGHVTIRHGSDLINFRIFFHDTRVTFTSFANEEEITFVADALEKIAQGREFRGPKTILDKFFA